MTSPEDAASPDAPETNTKSARPWIGLWFVVLGLAVIASAALAVVALRNRSAGSTATTQQIRVTGLPASVSTATANLMGLSPIKTAPAPNFTLTDQNGRTLSLSSLKGKAVVLEFMDPHCTDICPLVSKEFVDANRDLGANASKVVFVAVNVNQYYASVANMMAFSRAHNLVSIPSWHFFTGPTATLRTVWNDYGIDVSAPNPNADIIHTSLLYFIDPQGNERFIASPVVNHTSSGKSFLPAATLSAWGRGIAQVATATLG
ncbi:MAG TPA: SCO family protein [Acidimicrobiales bacterium]|nr:SCO family protein [Acidimicrobiales bacterium]